MNKKIEAALNEIGLTTYFVEKGKQEECIVYNYSSYPSNFADNEKLGDDYIILVNLYCKNNIEQYKKNILKSMNKNGFRGGSVQPTQLDHVSDTGQKIYNTAITFKAFLRTE